MALLLLLMVTPAAAAGGCGAHATRGECLLFRHQHLCVWDAPASSCVDSLECDKRTEKGCELELTTGEAWDRTRNLCFYDHAKKSCRFSDECFGLGKEECHTAGCVMRRMCTPADMRLQPGPNHCESVCTAPTKADASTINNNGTRAAAVTRRQPQRRRQQQSAAGPVVQTTGGAVQGLAASGGVETFLGVPFAQAPVGELRWAPPASLSWDGTFEATSNGASCVQAAGYTFTSDCKVATRGGCKGYSEDCLTMNIYTPASTAAAAAAASRSASRAAASTSSNSTTITTAASSASSSSLLPVMVWIHGGCYVSGSAASAVYDGTALAAAQNVVVVVVQYRLGVFGWLGADDLRSRDPLYGSTGNYGLLDNLAALEWLQDNLASFGGDKTSVSLFGQSSGAGSISQLLGAQPAWPYFHRAIAESGTASFWSYITWSGAQTNYKTVVKAAKCSGGSSAIVSCLLGADGGTLSNAVTTVPCRDGCTWAPAIDGAFLTDEPLALARAGKLRPSTPLIAGFNLNDGAMFVSDYPSAMYTESASGLSSYYSGRFGASAASTLQSTFAVPGKFPGAPSLSRYFWPAQACETDFSYSCCTFWVAAASASPTIIYQFSQPVSSGLSLHGDEIEFVFGNIGASPPSDVLKISEAMMSYWASFARTGDPNGGGDGATGGLLEWPAWDSATGSVLNITATPSVASVPGDSFLGCGFFDDHWDEYSGCLPP
jgi:para-nitrobenzyl esterase